MCTLVSSTAYVLYMLQGLSLAARAILLKLGTEAILSKAFAMFPVS